MKNRAGTQYGHPIPANVTVRVESANAGRLCYNCVSMLGEQGCPTVVGGELQKNVCASKSTASGSGSGEEQQLLTVLASDAPLYLIREEPESHPRIKLDDHYTTASSWVPPQSGFNHLGLVTPFLTLTDFERRLDAAPNWQ